MLSGEATARLFEDHTNRYPTAPLSRAASRAADQQTEDEHNEATLGAASTDEEATGAPNSLTLLSTPSKDPKKNDGVYLALARQFAHETAGQCATLGYHVHWIYK